MLLRPRPQALDAFVLRSPHDARGALPQILPVVLRCLAHDPNFADDMDAEADSEGGEDDEECAPRSCLTRRVLAPLDQASWVWHGVVYSDAIVYQGLKLFDMWPCALGHKLGLTRLAICGWWVTLCRWCAWSSDGGP